MPGGPADADQAAASGDNLSARSMKSPPRTAWHPTRSSRRRTLAAGLQISWITAVRTSRPQPWWANRERGENSRCRGRPAGRYARHVCGRGRRRAWGSLRSN